MTYQPWRKIIARHAPPGCRMWDRTVFTTRSKSPQCDRSPWQRKFALKGPKRVKSCFFLEMNKKCWIFFSSIYMIVKKYYTWDLIISKCYYILLWFSVVIIIIITVIIIIKIIDDSKNWGIHQQHWYFQSPIQFEGSFVLVFSPRQESPKTWGKDAGLVVLEPPWKNRVHQLGSPLSRADNFSKHHLDFLLVFPSIHGKFNADLLFYASNQW